MGDMNKKEKLPKLDVCRPSNSLGRRQLSLVVDENLTFVMDVRISGIISDKVLRRKDLEDFSRKWAVLSPRDLQNALQITKSEFMQVLYQYVPCVGCRKSVEELYCQLVNFGHPTLDPLIVKPDGSITIKEDKQAYQVLGSIFHDHSVRLAKLIENQPKKNKKSARCLLHCLDSQRSRTLVFEWRDVWDCMKPECKEKVCIIKASSLHSTLGIYLREHRSCDKCRINILKAFAFLIEGPEPIHEEGYVPSLYSGIKLCLPDEHIHLHTNTDCITKLLNRAVALQLSESRWDRHALTLEIAQEEILRHLGMYMYGRLLRINMRMTEEEYICQVFAAVAVHTLSRSFETAVERIRGVSQLELLYAEFAKEEQQKQIRKEQKKIKRKRKKGKIIDQEGKELCNDCDGDGVEEKVDMVMDCSCSSSKQDATVCCCNCQELLNNKSHHCSTNKLDDYEECSNMNSGRKDKVRCRNKLWIDDCKCENNVKEIKKNDNGKYDNYPDFNNKKECGSTSDHSNDRGYSSENNNGCYEAGSLISRISSSPEGSELACLDTCCQHETDFVSHCRIFYGGNGQQLSLQEMLESHSEDDYEDCYITQEEIREFKSNNKQLYEKRLELRDMLQLRFAQFYAEAPYQACYFRPSDGTVTKLRR